MYLSKLFVPIIKDLPTEAKIKSHQLMLRTGMIKQSSAGIYSWLPMGFKVSSRNVNANYSVIRNMERKWKI